MLIDAESLESGSTQHADVTVVGAGAAGIVLALELSRAGHAVNLVESGGPAYSERIQALAEATHLDPDVHPPMSECTRRQVGGTSVIWGGRVVPFDPVDLDERPYLPHSRWPIRFEEVRPFYERVCGYMLAGRPEFDIRAACFPGVKHTTIVPGLPDGEVTTTSLERWSVVNFGKLYERDLKASTKIRLIHGLTCTEIACGADRKRVACIRGKTLSGKTIELKSRRYVIACGGLNTTRLLLNSDGVHPGGIGNHSGQLGRFYTGHISGRIAEVQFSTPARETAFGFDRDVEGVYARRRFGFTREAQHKHRLNNIAAWLVNPEISDPAHGNGVLSFAYLILSSPMGKYLASEAIRKAAIEGDVQGRTMAHAVNMIRDFPRTAWFIPTFGYGRFLARRKTPGFFQYSASNTYTLHYFAEQAPNPDSRVTLVDDRDELGLRRISIDMRFTPQDVKSVIDSHTLWDEHLRKHNCGQLRYLVKDLEQSIWEQRGDGFHQCGTTRMSSNPAEGVVDARGCVHGFEDLFIASSSNFVTSSQANSMFMILVLALRLAEHLKATGGQ